MKFLLRRATHLDLNAIYEIEQDVQIVPWSKSAIMEELVPGRPALFWCLCPVENLRRVVAYACFRILSGELYLLNIAVDRRYQGCGLGSYLLRMLISMGKKRGVGRLVLDVHKENRRAIAFYKGRGLEFAADPAKVQGDFAVMEMKWLPE